MLASHPAHSYFLQKPRKNEERSHSVSTQHGTESFPMALQDRSAVRNTAWHGPILVGPSLD